MYEKYWKLHGGVDAISNRADGVGNSLLALGAQYGWQLAGMMLIGAALMRSGWLKGQFSLRHYRRTGFVLVAIGVTINLPAIALQWQLDWAYRWCAFLLQMPRELECAVSGDWLCVAVLWLLAAIKAALSWCWQSPASDGWR